ncbi:MAG: hypothetical protein J6V68_00850 [Clostridia bacterium]|nr:hypothetical protein [Clostridia bacterium]
MAKKNVFSSLAKTLEDLPFIVRLLLVIFAGVYGNLIRLFKSLGASNIIGIVLSIILLCTGGFVILWIIDLICILLGAKIWWID